ncbi:SGO1 protein, partial [Crypturellus undulatus]|nr:SGO1 protein [Crypturellus undulatus]
SLFTRPAVVLLKAPVSKQCDGERQNGSSSVVQTSTVDLQPPISSKTQEFVHVVSKDTLAQELGENMKKPNEAVETREASVECHVLEECLLATQQDSSNLPVLTWESHPLPHEDDEMVKDFCDRLSQGHVTQRRKRSTLFATSTPFSEEDLFLHIGPTRMSQGSVTKDSGNSNKNNAQQQLKSPSSLASPAQTAVDSDIKALGKEVLSDKPQTKETVCDTETDPKCSQVPELVPVKVKSRGNGKTTVVKTDVKKASTRKRNSIKSNMKNVPDVPQGEESTQNANKLQLKAIANSAGSEVPEMRQEACEGALEGKNRRYGACLYSHFPDKVRDPRRTYVVNPAQLHNLQSGDLVQEGEKEAVLEKQSVESLLKSPVRTFSTHKSPSDDHSLQCSLSLKKEILSICTLQQDSLSVSTKSTRQKPSRKTRVILQGSDSDEENVPKSVKASEVKAEEQPKRSKTRRTKTIRKSSSNDQRNEIEVSAPHIGDQGVAKESEKHLPVYSKCSRKTYVIHPLDLPENLDFIETDFEREEVVPSKCAPGSKASKIPRIKKLETAKNKKKWTGDLKEKGQTHNNTNALEKDLCLIPKPQSLCNPTETDLLARQSDRARQLPGSSAKPVSRQPVLTEKFSYITDLLSKPGAFLEEQIAEISLANNLMNISDSLESSTARCSVALPLGSSLTDLPVSKTLGTEDCKIPKKSSACPENVLTFKERRAEEILEGRNQAELCSKEHSQSSCLQKPEIWPLQDLTNAGTLCSPGSEEALGRRSKRRREPASYAEPKLNSKLRRGDPFTNAEFLHSPVYKSKKKKMTKAKTKISIKVEEEWLPE